MPIGINKSNSDISTYTMDPSPMDIVLNITIVNYDEYSSVKYAMIEVLHAPSGAYMQDPLNDSTSWRSDPIEINSDGTFMFQDAQDGLYAELIAGNPWVGFRIYFSEDTNFYTSKYTPTVIYLTSMIENINNNDDEQAFTMSYRIMLSKVDKMLPWGQLFYQMFVNHQFSAELRNKMPYRDICLLKADFDESNMFENVFNTETGFWDYNYESNQLLPSEAWRYCNMATISSVIEYYKEPAGYGYEPSLDSKMTGGTISWSISGNTTDYGTITMYDTVTSRTMDELVFVPAYTTIEISARPANSNYTIEKPMVTINVGTMHHVEVRFKAYKTSTKDKVTLTLSISNTTGTSYKNNCLTIYNRSSKDATEKGVQVATHNFWIMVPFNGNIITATTQIDVPSIQNTGYWYGAITTGSATLMNPYLQKETRVRQTQYTLHMDSAGVNKINVIRYMQSNMSMNYKEAKGLCDTAPTDIKTTTSYTQANTWKTELTNLGATISLIQDTSFVIGMPDANKSAITAELSVTTGIITGSTTGETVSGGRNYIIQIDNKRMKDNGDNRGAFSWYVMEASYKKSTATLNKVLPYAIEFIVSNWNSSSLSYTDGIGENYVYTLDAKKSEGTLYAGAFVFSNGKNGAILYNYFHDNIIIQNTEATNVKHTTSYGLYTETSLDIGDDSFVLYYNS